jgi:ATP-dependent Clp protease ATP-binding subunit ClpC
MGFARTTDESSYERMREKIIDESKRVFRPEFLNRLDDIIVFRSLTKDDMKHIVKIELEKVSKRLKEKNLALVLTEEAEQVLIDKGFSPEFGARPLKRTIENQIEDPLSEELLRGTYTGKDTIMVKVHEVDGEKKLSFEATGAPQPELVAAGPAESKN